LQPDVAGLDLLFQVPKTLIDTKVELSAAGENLTFSDNPVLLSGTWHQVALITGQQLAQNPSRLGRESTDDGITVKSSGVKNLLAKLPGKYRTYFGSSAKWWGIPGKCTNEDWDSHTGNSIDLPEAHAIISAAPGNDLFLEMENVGGAQLPKLKYVLRFLSATRNELTYDGDIAPAGWSFQCGNEATTAKASSSGHLKFTLNSNGSVLLTGTLMFTSDIPSCSAHNCATTYRDIYTFDHACPN
jgi:hypothetical protein